MYFKKSNTPITLQLFTLTCMWIGPRTKLNNEVISRPNINCIVSLSSSFRITTRADAAFLKDNYQCLILRYKLPEGRMANKLPMKTTSTFA